MILIGLTLGSILYTLIVGPDPTKISMWDFTGGVFTVPLHIIFLQKGGEDEKTLEKDS